MKTDRISLFILAIEIVLITLLHSAKNTAADPAQEMAKTKSSKQSNYSSFSLIGFRR